MPAAWEKPTDDSDYDLIALTLDRMEAAVGAGQRRQAEQARLEAYAFFEFGPERRLKSIDPGLATDIEGLIWYGAKGKPGLAELISKGAARRQVRATRLALDDELEDARGTLGDSASRTTVVTNSAIIVFREGLEAVLILAAITASFVGIRRRLRRPVLIGSILGLLASVFTWVLAQTLLQSLSRYGEKLEAVVGLVAIGVLLLVTNWFFHRVYWSEWIGRFHRQRRKLMEKEQAGFWSAQALGLVVLGLTSVYREGFETVLFLQSLELSAGATAVIEGAGLGLALTLGVARADLRAPAQAALQEDADRHRRAARDRARGHGRPDRAHDAGHRLAADHPAGLGDPVVAGAVDRRLPERRDAARPGRRDRVRDRLLRARDRAQGQAPAAQGRTAARQDRDRRRVARRRTQVPGRAGAFPGCRSPRRKVVSVSNASVYGEPVLGEVPGR